MMKVNNFFVNKLGLLMFLCIVTQLLACEVGYTMKTKDIPLKDLERYEFVARKYVENSRKWKLEEYRIKFLWFDDELNMAVFSAANLESLEKTAKAFRERGGETLMRDPSEFTVMVDTVGMKAYEDRKDIPTPWDPTIWPEKYQEH